jgi:RHS repeat-associated protein
VLDSSGNIVGETRYYPFGETRISTGSMFTDRLYTGQRDMASLGIYDYAARFYGPGLGRFIQPDTFTPGGPQGLNRYSYVLNNPVDSTDPTGHRNCEEDGYNCPGSFYSISKGTVITPNKTVTTASKKASKKISSIQSPTYIVPTSLKFDLPGYVFDISFEYKYALMYGDGNANSWIYPDQVSVGPASLSDDGDVSVTTSNIPPLSLGQTNAAGTYSMGTSADSDTPVISVGEAAWAGTNTPVGGIGVDQESTISVAYHPERLVPVESAFAVIGGIASGVANVIQQWIANAGQASPDVSPLPPILIP